MMFSIPTLGHDRHTHNPAAMRHFPLQEILMSELNEFFATLADEERAAASAHLASRIAGMSDQDDGPIRARIFAASTHIAGAELFANLDSPQAAAAQLRRLADRIDAGQAVKH
jgi:hypothetical protein